MRNPLEVAADLYDYQYQYVRWFLHRRVIFNEVSAREVKDDMSVNLFANDDSQNVAKMVTTSTTYGAFLGLGIGGWRYAMLTEINKQARSKGLPAIGGIFALCTAAGFTYGALVNTTSQFRGGKNDLINHVTGTMAIVPVSGVFAKRNRLQWGILNAMIASVIVGYIKYAYGGNFIGGIASNSFTNVKQEETSQFSEPGKYVTNIEKLLVNKKEGAPYAKATPAIQVMPTGYQSKC